MSDPAVWFVTGAATGFGRAIVDYVAQQGCRVVATARDANRLKELVSAYPERILPLALDVTSPSQVRAAITEAERVCGGVDVLVNNAGYGFIAAIEEAEEDETKRVYDTHLMGPISLIKAVLPGMRARKSGHIFNFSSVAGLSGSAGTGHYAAAKHAIEGLSESLAKEVAEFGVKVTIVEPGPFKTNFFSTTRQMGRTQLPAYDATSGAYRIRAQQIGDLPGDPERGAKAVFEASTLPDPPLHLPLGRFAHDMALDVLHSRIAEVERWKDLSLSADFPEWRDRPWP